MNRSNSIVLFISLLGLILFDAAQQKYYMDRFQLAPAGDISYYQLLVNHLSRWAIWFFCSIPLAFMLGRTFRKSLRIYMERKVVFGGIILLTVTLSLVLVSFQSIISQSISFTWPVFSEVFIFFIFQKGLSFMITSVLLMLLMVNYYKTRSIDAQEVEIMHLKKYQDELSELFQHDTTPHLEVKTGYKSKSIPLEEIVWIQADDYCVKIHTIGDTYTLRQSLKHLESKLAPFKFTRIHRGALLNLSYIDQINYQKSTVTLKDTSEIPFSKNGIRSLKERLSSSAI